MGGINKDSGVERSEQDIQAYSTVGFMDTEMRFNCQKFAEAFQKDISEEARKRLWAYYKTRKTIDAIRLLGLTGSCEEFQKRLRQIAKRIGASSIKELFGWKASNRTKKIDAEFLKRLIEKQEYRCALSGVVLTPDEAELDHTVPFEQGGRHTKANVQWVHKEVNRMKSQMRQVEFVEWCRKVAAWQR
jgi:hypothetical protein